MNEVWRARSGIVARGRVRSRRPGSGRGDVAVCAFTAAGKDRFTAVGQRIRRASQADLARPRAPWDPIAGRYRAPDEKTIRVVLHRLDPRARLPCRRAAQLAKAPVRDRLRAVAVDGKTSRGARRVDGTRVHLLGVAGHGGRLLDHLEVGVEHNETSHFTELLEPLDLDDAVVTTGALHTVRANPELAGQGQGSPLYRRRETEPARYPGHHPRRHHRGHQDAGYLHVPEGRRDHTIPAENSPPPRPRLPVQ
jgi:hypothetical protein